MSYSNGIFVTQNGVSVTKAAQWQFVFNSNWPSLQCALDQTITLGPSGSQTITHNLGFPPLTLAWSIVGGVSQGRIFAVSESFQSNTQVDVSVTFDSTNVYLSNTSGSATYNVNVKSYNVDISQSVNYQLPAFPPYKTGYDPNVGIKVAKYGYPITSQDLRTFILHSRAQSPAVLSIVTANSGNGGGLGQGGAIYANPARYVPWVLAYYVDNNGHWSGIVSGFQQTGAIFRLGNLAGYLPNGGTGAILNSTVANTNLSLVVLRDPLVASNFVAVQY